MAVPMHLRTTVINHWWVGCGRTYDEVQGREESEPELQVDPVLKRRKLKKSKKRLVKMK